MTIRVKKIICHYDNGEKYIEVGYSYNQRIDLPYAAGKLQELFPRPDKLEDAREVVQPLFNQSGLANIVVEVGQHGIYYLALRVGYVLKDIILDPDSVIADIYFGQKGELIYSFYNPTNRPAINIKAALTVDNEGVSAKLKADPDDLIWRQYFIRKSLVKYDDSVSLPRKQYPELMTAEQVAEYLRVEKKTIHNWTSSGKIHSV